MSRHLYETAHQGQPIQIVLGWDRAQQTVFLSIQALTPDSDADSDSIPDYFSALDADNEQTIASCYRALRSLGLHIPASVFQQVARDQRTNAGNRILKHESDGTFTILYDEAASQR